MFEVLLIAQLGLIALLMHQVCQARNLAAANPALLILSLHVFAFYILPQLGLLAASPFDVAPEDRLGGLAPSQVIWAQFSVVLFLVTFLAGMAAWSLISHPTRTATELTWPRGPEARVVLYIGAAVGLICVILLDQQFSGVAYRSQVVKGAVGQLLLAGSMFCHFFLVLLAFSWWREGRRLWPIFVIGLAVLVFFYMGGRARALSLPIYLAWMISMHRFSVTWPKVFLVVVLMIAAMPLAVDFKRLALTLRLGTEFTSAADWTTLPNAIVNGSMLSSFKSLSLVQGLQGQSIGDPGTWFMMTFYPGVWRMGVGLHLGFLGESYLLFGVPGILLCGLALGLGAGALGDFYRTSSQASTRLLLIITAAFLFAVGYNFLGSLMKNIASIAAPIGWIVAGAIFRRGGRANRAVAREMMPRT